MATMEPIALALFLTLFAGLSTSIGAVMGIMNKKPTPRFLSFVMAFSAGVMLFLSFAEMFAEAEEVLGMPTALVFLVLGLGIALLIDVLLPEQDNPHEHLINGNSTKDTKYKEIERPRCITDPEITEHGMFQKHNGVKIVQFPLKMRENGTKEVLGYQKGQGKKFGQYENIENPIETDKTVVSSMMIDSNNIRTHGFGQVQQYGGRHRRRHKRRKAFLDEEWCEEMFCVDNKKMLKLGLFTLIALFIHNLPEGLATFSATLYNPMLGIEIALATALHNIPEGICVAVPIFSATKSKKKAFGYATISGMAEPLGAIIAWSIFSIFVVSDQVLVSLLALVAGIMIYISVDTLIPTAKSMEYKHTSIAGFSLGMVLMGISLVFLH